MGGGVTLARGGLAVDPDSGRAIYNGVDRLTEPNVARARTPAEGTDHGRGLSLDRNIRRPAARYDRTTDVGNHCGGAIAGEPGLQNRASVVIGNTGRWL